MGRHKEHNEHTAEALLDAAEEAIAKAGVDALSLRDAARDAGTTTRAIYTLFGSKEALLGALGVRAFTLIKRDLDAQPVTDEPVASLVEGALVFRRFALEHPALFSIAFHRCDPAVNPRFRAARLDALASLQKRFEPLANANMLGGRSLSEATMQLALLTEGIAWGELRGNPMQPDPERFWRNAVFALVSGFASPTPRNGAHAADDQNVPTTKRGRVRRASAAGPSRIRRFRPRRGPRRR